MGAVSHQENVSRLVRLACLARYGCLEAAVLHTCHTTRPTISCDPPFFLPLQNLRKGTSGLSPSLTVNLHALKALKQLLMVFNVPKHTDRSKLLIAKAISVVAE
jgi:hypothetical protein